MKIDHNLPNRLKHNSLVSGFAPILLILILVFVVVLGFVGIILFSQQKSDTVLGTNTTDPDRLYVINDTRVCNAFNIRSVTNYANLTFDQSLQIALNTLDNNRNLETSVLVNRYGPWCDNEAHPAGNLPFAYNLFYQFIDQYAEFGAARYKVNSNGTWSTTTCRTPQPKKYPRPEDVGVACNAMTLRAAPGDPYFDYYRGMFTRVPGSCTLKTHDFPSGVAASTVIDTFVNDDPDYLDNYFNDQSNFDLYNLRRKQLKHLVYSAKERNINPYLVMGLWATESGFSNRPSCYGNGGPSTELYQAVIRAYGTPDPTNQTYPIMVLKVRGLEVKRWTVTGTSQNYSAHIDTTDTAQIRVHFINDNGPRNLYVRHLKLAGRYYLTTDEDTYSTGTWTADNFCGGGKKRLPWLHCNGYFWFNAP